MSTHFYGVDVAPGFLGRAGGGFDGAQMDAVGPEIRPPHQGDDLGGTLGGGSEGFFQAVTLITAHGAVDEGEVEVSHPMALVIPDVVIAWGFGEVERSQDLGGGQFQSMLFFGPQMADPYRAVTGGSCYRTAAMGEQGSGLPWKAIGGMGVVEIDRAAVDAVEETGGAVGAADLA